MRQAFANVAGAISEFEPVTMVAAPEFAADASLKSGRGVSVFTRAHDDCWLRDNGPTFVVDDSGGVAGVDWGFNAWGELYPRYADDAALAAASEIAERRSAASASDEVAADRVA